ncbi:MAG TPA: DUF503 domain-containing protein [Firmicutes bacterium]|nr:DUF503 domain-containing protein [Bacillota bacterium]
MFLGTLVLELSLPGCDSLKEKRHRLKGVIERIRDKFNVSVSEVDFHDIHQSALVAIAMVNTEKKLIEQVFSRVEEFFANGDGLLIINNDIEWY